MQHYGPFVENAKRILLSSEQKFRHYILCLDITDFRSFNHFYGFEAGSNFLLEIQEYLENLSQILLVRRFYSDCFLCLASSPAGLGDKELLAECRKYFSAFLTSRQEAYPACTLKIACGVCTVEKKSPRSSISSSLADAIDGANAAQKESKKRGSHSPVLFDQDMSVRLSAQYAQEHANALALHENRFCFYLQPKVSLTTGKIVGAEALARQKSPDGKIIPPDIFLPLMEANGSVVELDRMICAQVCAFLSQRLKNHLPAVPTSVNLSRIHIQNPSSADRFHGIAEHYGIPPRLLEFELTETILLQEFSGAKQLIDRLRALGHPVSIDDFGSGYAGMNIWQELTFDILKLDKNFLSQDPERSLRNEILIPHLIQIGRRLHTRILCEGVEDLSQCLYLKKLGCFLAQGYYFSPPVPPDIFYTYYENHSKLIPCSAYPKD